MGGQRRQSQLGLCGDLLSPPWSHLFSRASWVTHIMRISPTMHMALVPFRNLKRCCVFLSLPHEYSLASIGEVRNYPMLGKQMFFTRNFSSRQNGFGGKH